MGEKRPREVAPYTVLARDYDRELGHIFEVFQRPLLDSVRAALAAGHRPIAVLDLACGSGRVATHFARRGDRVVAVDRSLSMLRRGRRRPWGRSVYWIGADMTRVRLRARFDLICCNFDSVNHLLRPADVRRLFAAAALHLRGGGRFVFDVNTALALKTVWTDLGRTIEQDRHAAVWKATYDTRRRLAILVADYFLRRGRGYEHLREVHQQRAHSPAHLLKWLNGTGLQVQRTFADGCWGEPPADSLRIAYVCQHG